MLLKAKDLMPGMQVDLAENPYVTQGKAVKELYFEVSSVEKREDGYVHLEFHEFESVNLPENYEVYIKLKSNEKYKAQNTFYCPRCDSIEVKHEQIKGVTEEIVVYNKCFVCGYKWIDFYKFDRYEGI